MRSVGLGLLSVEFLGLFGAGGHGGFSHSVSTDEGRGVIGVFLAGAHMWVVFSDEVDDLLILSEFLGSVVESSEPVPEVISEVGNGTSSSVDSLDLVQRKFGTEHLGGHGEEDGSSVHDFSDNKLETSWGHWDSGSLTGV